MANQICISNIMCINTYFIIIILVSVLLYTIMLKQKSKEIIKKVYIDTASKLIEKRPQDERPELYRKVYDKLEEPTRLYDNRINIRTRGELPSYQNIGYLYREESDPTYNPEDKNRFALYGRPTYSGSDTWEYYITDQDVKITLSNKKEIMTGDEVSITGFAGKWKAHINDYQEYRYIPYIY